MKKVLWSLANTFIGRGFSVLFAIIIGNLLLPEKLGLYLSLMLVVNYALSLAFIKIETGAVQRINSTQDYFRKNVYFTWGLFSVFFISLIVIIGLYIFKEYVLRIFKLSDYKNLYLVLIPLIFLRALRNYQDLILTAIFKFKQRTIINLSAAIVQIVGTLVFLKMGMGLRGIIGSLYIANFLAVLWVSFVCLKNFRITMGNNGLKLGADLFKFSSILYIGSIAVFLDKQIDLFFVNYYLPKEDLSIYNYALQFAFLLLMFGNSISHVTFPQMSKNFALKSQNKINEIYEKSINFSYYFLSIATLLVGIHLKSVISLLLPEFYLKIIPPMFILGSVLLIFATFSSVGTIFTAKGIPQYGLLLNWSSLAVNIILLAIFVPRYGYIGAACATAFSFGIRAIGSRILIEHKIKTGYRYGKIILTHILFLCLFITGFRTQNFLAKGLLFLGYVAYATFFFLSEENRKCLKLWLKKGKR